LLGKYFYFFKAFCKKNLKKTDFLVLRLVHEKIVGVVGIGITLGSLFRKKKEVKEWRNIALVNLSLTA